MTTRFNSDDSGISSDIETDVARASGSVDDRPSTQPLAITVQPEEKSDWYHRPIKRHRKNRHRYRMDKRNCAEPGAAAIQGPVLIFEDYSCVHQVACSLKKKSHSVSAGEKAFIQGLDGQSCCAGAHAV